MRLIFFLLGISTATDAFDVAITQDASITVDEWNSLRDTVYKPLKLDRSALAFHGNYPSELGVTDEDTCHYDTGQPLSDTIKLPSDDYVKRMIGHKASTDHSSAIVSIYRLLSAPYLQWSNPRRIIVVSDRAPLTTRASGARAGVFLHGDPCSVGIVPSISRIINVLALTKSKVVILSKKGSAAASGWKGLISHNSTYFEIKEYSDKLTTEVVTGAIAGTNNNTCTKVELGITQDLALLKDINDWETIKKVFYDDLRKVLNEKIETKLALALHKNLPSQMTGVPSNMTCHWELSGLGDHNITYPASNIISPILSKGGNSTSSTALVSIRRLVGSPYLGWSDPSKTKRVIIVITDRPPLTTDQVFDNAWVWGLTCETETIPFLSDIAALLKRHNIDLILLSSKAHEETVTEGWAPLVKAGAKVIFSSYDTQFPSPQALRQAVLASVCKSEPILTPKTATQLNLFKFDLPIIQGRLSPAQVSSFTIFYSTISSFLTQKLKSVRATFAAAGQSVAPLGSPITADPRVGFTATKSLSEAIVDLFENSDLRWEELNDEAGERQRLIVALAAEDATGIDKLVAVLKEHKADLLVFVPKDTSFETSWSKIPPDRIHVMPIQSSIETAVGHALVEKAIRIQKNGDENEEQRKKEEEERKRKEEERKKKEEEEEEEERKKKEEEERKKKEQERKNRKSKKKGVNSAIPIGAAIAGCSAGVGGLFMLYRTLRSRDYAAVPPMESDGSFADWAANMTAETPDEVLGHRNDQENEQTAEIYDWD